jgi:nucleotide-binding universal stress UspA family protein
MKQASDRRPVVVGVDGSPGSAAAVRWAARYAAETGAPLRILHASTGGDTMTVLLPVPVGVSSAGLRRPGPTTEQVLAAATTEATHYHPDLDVTAGMMSGPAVQALLDASGEAALLVLGSCDRSRVATTVFGSVATRVVGAAHCPTVVVRGESDPAAPIVVAVDASDSCEPALRFAFGEAARRGCPLFAVHAWQPPLGRSGAGALGAAAMAGATARQDLAAAVRETLSATVTALRATFPDVVVHERLLDGHPETAIPAETSGAALAVVGSRGRGPLAGLLLGSTSQALVHMSTCPVAVVRETGDETTA